MSEMLEWLENPRREPVAPAANDGDATAFHRALPGYEPTPLIDAPELAREWDVGSVRLKFERDRFGLPAFKFLGASWAVRRLLGEPPYEPGQTLVTATDGNHGRAVARVARLNGLAATIVVPEGTVAARIAAIEAEGAEVLVVDGGYDAAVRRSAELAGPGRHLVSDTSWPGYERVPRWVIEGYATIFAELDTQLDGAPPDLAVIPIGVGALAAAAARHLAGRSRLLGVEPTDAACVLESVRAGEPVELDGPQDSLMAGLNCGTPSLVAWPDVSAGFDVLCAIGDELAVSGMRRLAEIGVEAGECSGGCVGAAGAVLADPAARAALAVSGASSVCVLLTEAVTDPDAYARLVG
ncbi:MAG: pyridoxal-phosphate dependent enzyme [Solirubrobacterales bacterium]